MTEDDRPRAPEPPAAWPAPSVGAGRGLDRGQKIAVGVVGGLVLAGLALVLSTAGPGETPVAALDAADAGPGLLAEADDEPDAGEDAGAPAPVTEAPPSTVFRVASLKDDPGVVVVEGTVGRRALVEALAKAQVSRADAARLVKAFRGVRSLDRIGEDERYVVARDRATGALKAFELEASPRRVYQAREGDEGRLVAQELVLEVVRRRVPFAVAVVDDLRHALAAQGVDETLAHVVDDALAPYVEMGSVARGSRLRLLAVEERVDGAKDVAYAHVDAIEYLPTKGSGIRVYQYSSDDPDGTGKVDEKRAKRRRRSAGYFDAKGQRPYHGAFRSPIPQARITSKFNPKRLHPVLKVVMPHNGIDFGGATGTPVYAASAGTVSVAGASGPCGNMVELRHPGGLTTAYCHLSKFAPGLKPGQSVETRQLVGYVGQTGRVTGPHLHFAVKRNGAFVDPLGLKLDGMIVVPKEDREAFAKRRVELDAALDQVKLPDPPSGAVAEGDDDSVLDVPDDAGDGPILVRSNAP